MSNEAPWGTLFISRKLTGCPLCQAPIPPRTLAVMTSWTKRERPDDRLLARGPAGAVHVDCAEHRGIEVRWTARRIFADLRYSIATIKGRKLRG